MVKRPTVNWGGSTVSPQGQRTQFYVRATNGGMYVGHLDANGRVVIEDGNIPDAVYRQLRGAPSGMYDAFGHGYYSTKDYRPTNGYGTISDFTFDAQGDPHRKPTPPVANDSYGRYQASPDDIGQDAILGNIPGVQVDKGPAAINPYRGAPGGPHVLPRPPGLTQPLGGPPTNSIRPLAPSPLGANPNQGSPNHGAMLGALRDIILARGNTQPARPPAPLDLSNRFPNQFFNDRTEGDILARIAALQRGVGRQAADQPAVNPYMGAPGGRF